MCLKSFVFPFYPGGYSGFSAFMALKWHNRPGKHREGQGARIGPHSSGFSAKSQGSDPFDKMCMPSGMGDRWYLVQISRQIPVGVFGLNNIWYPIKWVQA